MSENFLWKQNHNTKNYKKHTPYPVRLGELKPLLMQKAVEEERSMHYIIVKALEQYCEKEIKIA